MSNVDTNEQFFFILGRGRSGTTLLRTILNKHPEIVIPQETLFVMNIYSKYHKIINWTEKLKVGFFKDIWLDKKLVTNLSINREELRKEIMEASPKSSFADMCKLVYSNHARAETGKDIHIIGDKNPLYSLFPQTLSEAFIGAKFVFLTRNHKDNILSFQKVNFDFNKVNLLAYRWDYYNQAIYTYYQEHPELFLWITYENLLNKPRETLGNVCDFLGVDFDDKILNFQETGKKNVSWHAKLGKAIDKDNIEKWRKEMTPSNILIADTICKNMASNLSYETDLKTPNISQSLSITFGKVLGWLSIMIEKKLIYSFPLKLRSSLILLYRIKTGAYKRINKK